LEVQDVCSPILFIDNSGENTDLKKWSDLCLEASIKLGVPLDSVKSVKKIMEDVGYVDVVETVYQWPMNRWPAEKKMKEIGICSCIYF
jgi:hypothetical protein